MVGVSTKRDQLITTVILMRNTWLDDRKNSGKRWPTVDDQPLIP